MNRNVRISSALEVKPLAASIGYTNALMWNGSYGDSTPIRPREILRLARQYSRPGTSRRTGRAI
jgi:hypothetical protein